MTLAPEPPETYREALRQLEEAARRFHASADAAEGDLDDRGSDDDRR